MQLYKHHNEEPCATQQAHPCVISVFHTDWVKPGSRYGICYSLLVYIYIYIYIYICMYVCMYVYTGSAKKMYTHFNERKLYVVCYY